MAPPERKSQLNTGDEAKDESASPMHDSQKSSLLGMEAFRGPNGIPQPAIINTQNNAVKAWFSSSVILENTGSVARDHLASERTWLAYIRTSMTVAGMGVGTYTFVLSYEYPY